jgi:hypothetical protein
MNAAIIWVLIKLRVSLQPDLTDRKLLLVFIMFCQVKFYIQQSLVPTQIQQSTAIVGGDAIAQHGCSAGIRRSQLGRERVVIVLENMGMV